MKEETFCPICNRMMVSWFKKNEFPKSKEDYFDFTSDMNNPVCPICDMKFDKESWDKYHEQNYKSGK